MSGDGPRLDASPRHDFRTDRALDDGEGVGYEATIEAITHAGGHTAKPMAYAFKEANVVRFGTT